MNTGEYVEIKESSGNRWRWTGRKGHVIDADKHCYTVRADDGEEVRDVREHFRVTAV